MTTPWWGSWCPGARRTCWTSERASKRSTERLSTSLSRYCTLKHEAVTRHQCLTVYLTLKWHEIEYLDASEDKTCNSLHSFPLDTTHPSARCKAPAECNMMLCCLHTSDYRCILNALFSEKRLPPWVSHELKQMSLFSWGQMFRRSYCHPPVELPKGQYWMD